MPEPPPVALLFVPGHRESMVAKAREVDADAVVFDLEDSVPPDQKQTARQTVAQALGAWPETGAPSPYVRIQAPRLGEIPADAAVFATNSRVGIMVPKVDRPIELHALRNHVQTARRPILVVIETPRALFHLEALADATYVEGLCLGGEDLASSLGLRDTSSGSALDVAGTLIVAAARAAGIGAFGGICPEFRDMDIVTREAAATVEAGFDGKLAIHPAQLPVIRDAFMPTKDQISWAADVIAAFDAAIATGAGAVQVHGQMVDQPVADRARAIQTLAERLGSGNGQ